jgi:hypothetical protein
LLEAESGMSKQLFINEHHNELFNKNGYLLCDYDQGEVADELKAIYDHYCAPQLSEGVKFYYSLMNPPAFNLELKEKVAGVLAKVYNTFLKNYHAFSESVMVKKSHDFSELFLHQDWSYVEEKKSISATLWLPLQSVTAENGAFFFIKGSHLWFNNLRSPTIPSIRIQALPEYAHLLETVNVCKGQLLFFHPALWHGSHPNQSADHRAVVAAIVKPQKDPLLYYYRKNTWVYKYEINENLFLEQLPHLSVGETPSAFNHKSLILFPCILTENALRNKLQQHER